MAQESQDMKTSICHGETLKQHVSLAFVIRSYCFGNRLFLIILEYRFDFLSFEIKSTKIWVR